MLHPKQIARYFIQGCLTLAPLALTIYIVYLMLKFADRIFPFEMPGVGIAAAAVVITLVGFITSSVIGRGVLELAERALTRVPLVKLIYASLKDLVGAFVGDRRSFNQPVTVALTPDRAIQTLGFITRDDLGTIGLPQLVAVYLPQSYNFAGNLILVPRDRVEPLAVSSKEMMTFIVSGGVSGFSGLADDPSVHRPLPGRVPVASGAK